MPARNSRGTDCSATMPYRISGRLGGMTMPIVPDAPTTPERERARIAALDHRRDQDRPHRQRGRDARAADRREQRAGDHGDQTERARKPAEPGGGQIDQRLGDAAEAHEGRRHHEQRQRHQGRRVELVDDELRGADQRLAGAANMAPAQSPSTRKIGMPAASRPKNSDEEAGHGGGSIDARQLMAARRAAGAMALRSASPTSPASRMT